MFIWTLEDVLLVVGVGGVVLLALLIRSLEWISNVIYRIKRRRNR